MRQGSHPSACAASSTVALDCPSTRTRSASPNCLRYSFTFSNAIFLFSVKAGRRPWRPVACLYFPSAHIRFSAANTPRAEQLSASMKCSGSEMSQI